VFTALLLQTLGCTPPKEPSSKPNKIPGQTVPRGDDDDDDTPVVDSVDSGTPTPTGTTADTSTIDCSVLPPAPFAFSTLNGYGTAEDFDFDVYGHHVSVQSGNILGIDRYGAATPLAVGIGGFTAGTRVLSTGDVLMCDSSVGGLTLVDMATGGRSTVISGMSYPNGLEIDTQDRGFVADQSRGAVLMVDVYASPPSAVVVADGLSNPNGVILSPDEQTLYVGSFGGGMVYAIDRISDTEWDTPRILHQAGANGGFDGINVDLCGTVYLTEYTTGRIFRIDPSGASAPEQVADVPSSWIPNMRWGNGVGGWDDTVLFVSDRNGGRLFGLQVGIPGKPHVGL
jgi:hypothetical protein